MQFRNRFVVCAVSVSLFAGWLLAEGVERTDLPATLKEIQEGVRHLSQEVKSLQSAVKELAAASKHGTMLPQPFEPPHDLKPDLERARDAFDRGTASEKLKL